MSVPLEHGGKRKPWSQIFVPMLSSLGWVAFIALSFCAWEAFYPTQVAADLSYHVIEAQ